MILLWLIMCNILTYNVTKTFLTAYNTLDISTGTISSIVFFIHIKILSQRRRNAFRNRSHNTASSNTIQEINDGQRITVAGSVSATHVTDFNPPGESDVEP